MAIQELPNEASSKKKIYFFIGGVFLLSIFSFWFTNQDYFTSIVQPLLNVYTKISSFILNLFGYQTSARNEILSSPEFSLEVKKGCDAVAPMILYTLSILFFPSPFKGKLKAIGIGILWLFLLNIVRIVTLFFTKKYYPESFDFVHTELWQIMFIVFTMFLWLRWLKGHIAKNPESHEKA